mmetsp:Transcript_62023/g.134526  ORF Transcript_62023/g.134526 Transcript_62023/m.134526 type:complete len:233 (-) Transcript_62023:105-803(-)
MAASDPVVITYWAGRGRVEPLRNIIAAGGGQMTNVGIGSAADFKALKDSGKLLYEQVPLIQVDGVDLVQTHAAAVYLSRKFGLYPSAPLEEYLVLQIYHATYDARYPLVALPFVGGEKEQALQSFSKYLTSWHKQLESTPGGEGPFFLGARATLADVAVFESLDFWKFVGGDEKFHELLAPFPKLVELYVATKKLGRLAEWCDVERPKFFVSWEEYPKLVLSTLNVTFPIPP